MKYIIGQPIDSLLMYLQGNYPVLMICDQHLWILWHFARKYLVDEVVDYGMYHMVKKRHLCPKKLVLLVIIIRPQASEDYAFLFYVHFMQLARLIANRSESDE